MEIEFPYQDVPAMTVPEENLIGVFSNANAPPPDDVPSIIRKALESPYGAARLSELARGRERVLIVVDDISRPTPVADILPLVVDELQDGGVQEGQIEILLALGTHRSMTAEEIAEKLGDAIVARFPVYNHEWANPQACELIGTTPRGVEVWMNRKVMESDLVIGIGLIMPIDISGFTGGGKILVPGVCGKLTIDTMHWYRVDEPDEEIVGKRDNSVRAAIDEMARRAGLEFIVNVIMDRDHGVLAAVAGDLVEAHREGCRLALKAHSVHLPHAADIVVADSHPFDAEFWQANKALDQAALAVRKGGVVILVTPCYEGFSATHNQIVEIGYPHVAKIKEMVRSGTIQSKVVAVHMIQVSKVAREWATVILVTTGISAEELDRVGLDHAPTPQKALDRAFELTNRSALVAVLRGAAETIPIVEHREQSIGGEDE